MAFNWVASFSLILPWDGGTGRAAQGRGISQTYDGIGDFLRSNPAHQHAGGAFPAGSTGGTCGSGGEPESLHFTVLL